MVFIFNQDPRVAFFEPLKFVARMRGERRKYLDKVQPTNPEERLLLLRVDDVGHGGNSGQYSPLEDLAFEYAFLISALEASTKPFYIGLPTTTLLTSPASSPNVRKKFTSSPSFSSWAAARIGSNIVEYDSEGSDGEYSITQGKSRKKRTKEDAEEKQYRSKTKGDRSQNKVFQWVANFF